jgi:hypothetical protein
MLSIGKRLIPVVSGLVQYLKITQNSFFLCAIVMAGEKSLSPSAYQANFGRLEHGTIYTLVARWLPCVHLNEGVLFYGFSN